MAKEMMRQSVVPVGHPRSNRMIPHEGLTTLPAGKIVPVFAYPILREDGVKSGNVRVNLELMETHEILMNPVEVNVQLWFIPFSAFERFQGSMDQFNRSYAGQPITDDVGAAVTPFFEWLNTLDVSGNKIHWHLGLHHQDSDYVNSAYVEAYNLMVNYRRKNRSPDLALRTRLQCSTLANAFWHHSKYAHLVPDFDQAKIDGEVPLILEDPQGVKVRGMGLTGAVQTRQNVTYRDSTHSNMIQDGYLIKEPATAAAAGLQNLFVRADVDGYPQIYADLEDSGVRLSLAGIQQARQTQYFARLREKFSGHDDDWIIEFLMNGLTIPEMAFRYPMLVASAMTQFGQAKRYSSTAGELDESATSGGSSVELRWTMPRIPTGGIFMCTAEVVPKQLWERQRDPLLFTQTVAQLPETMRDVLDVEKVVAVPNGYMDAMHSSPNGLFSYAPLNHEWANAATRIGGEFWRASTDTAFDERRQRIWAMDTADPTLAESFYTVQGLNLKPFLVTNQDPVDCWFSGMSVVNGNTVFGDLLIEASDDYDKVAAMKPAIERIEK